VPAELADPGSPEYVPEMVSVPTGAAEDVHEPVPALDKIAVQSGVAPVEKATDPLGVGKSVAIIVTVAEYVTEAPSVTVLGFAAIEVDDGCLTTRVVEPVEPEKLVSPEYVPEIGSLPTGAAEELHEPLPFDNVAMHSVVGPVVKVTDPVGVKPEALVVTLAE
jgi:hypothetical protein